MNTHADITAKLEAIRTTPATEPATTWSFDIPEANLEALRTKLGHLAKRAVKLGIEPLTVTEGEPKDVKRTILLPNGLTTTKETKIK